MCNDFCGRLDVDKGVGKKMDFVWFLLIALISGVLAGMGMGGGTLLIPALTILMGVEQEVAQSTNLLVFVPCAIVCIIIYAKSSLINFKKSWIIVVASVVVSVIAALIAVKIESKILKIIFGSFIALLGLVQLIVYIIKKCKEKKQICQP